MTDAILQTTVVGSYPQPDWLVNREMLSKVVPRTRMREIWRVPEPFLEQAQDDATLIAIRDMERVVLGLLEERLGHAHARDLARARHDLAQHLAIDQPVGLRIGADDGGLEEHV